MLSFNLIKDGKAIQIHFDDKGAAALIGALVDLMREGGGHKHLWSDVEGWAKLDAVTPFGEEAVHEVMIDYDPPDTPENTEEE